MYVFLVPISTHSSDRVRCYMRVGLAKRDCVCVSGWLQLMSQKRVRARARVCV